jgi:PKD repeat protein
VKNRNPKNNRRNNPNPASNRARAPRPAGRRRQPLLEPLENRQMLSAATLDSGVLWVSGQSTDASHLVVTRDGSRLTVKADDVTQTYKTSQVNQINLTGGSASDYLSIGKNIKIPALIDAGEGDNTIRGGAGNDTILSGTGNDVIAGRNGKNLVTDLNASGVVIVPPVNVPSVPTGPMLLSDALAGDLSAAHSAPTVKNLKVSTHDRQVTVTAAAQPGVTYQVEVQGNETAPRTFVANGSLPLTFTPPIADRIFGLIVTPIANGVKGQEVAQVLDVGRVASEAEMAQAAPPIVKNLNVTTQDRQVTVTADTQPGVTYQVEVQGNETAPRTFVANGALPLTFTPPIADQVFGLIITPIANGVMGQQAVQVVDVGRVADAAATTPAPSTAPIPSSIHLTDSSPQATQYAGTHVNANLHAAITLVNSSTLAGGAIQLDGLASTLGGYSADQVHYAWNFGDVDANGQAAPYNQLSGFNAAHVYASAGTYTVTLTLTDPTGGTTQAQSTITVQQDNRRTIYVAAEGNDGNSGLSADQPIQSINRAMQLLTDNTRLLFKSGESYAMTRVFSLPYSNVLIGAYGQGDKPRLNWSGSGDTMFSTEPQSNNIIIQGLSFDTPSARNNTDQGPPFAVKTGGTNIVVRDNEFLNVGYAVNANEAPTGLLVQDNTAPLVTGIRGYFVWVEGRDVTIVGNTVANVTREHVVRMRFDPTGINVSFNDFTNLDRRGQGDSQDIAKNDIFLEESHYAYVGGNKLGSGGMNIGPLAAHDAGIQGATTDYVVVEGNQLNGSGIDLVAGLHHATLTNNVIRRDTVNPDNGTEALITVGGYDSFFHRGIEDVAITHNTGITQSAQGIFLNLTGKADRLLLDNNLYVAPNLLAGAYGTSVLRLDGGLDSFSEIRGNIWPSARTDGWDNGGLLTIAGSSGTGNGFESPAQWEAHANVEEEQFLNLTLNNGYQVSANGVTAGARLAA